MGVDLLYEKRIAAEVEVIHRPKKVVPQPVCLVPLLVLPIHPHTKIENSFT